MKTGFVAIVGRPNVGKSTLLNAFLDYDLAIISKTPQTTRDEIKGIYNDTDSQIIFVDTPGIHKPKSKLGTSLNNASYRSLKDIDLILFLTPANEKIGPGDKMIIKKIANYENKIAIISKTDLVSNKDELNAKSDKLKKFGFKLVLGISSLNSHGPKIILNDIKEYLSEGHKYFEENLITDKPAYFIAKETIRGEVLQNVYDEVGHSIAVVIIEYKEDDSQVNIRADIYVERNSQKGIIIGHRGQMIKKIGMESRQKIANLLGKKTRLDLQVKVEKNWTKKTDKLKKLGY